MSGSLLIRVVAATGKVLAEIRVMSEMASGQEATFGQAIPWSVIDNPVTIHELITSTRDRVGDRDAFSFQLLSSPDSAADTLTWNQFHEQVTRTANMFRGLGIGENDVIAYLLPNTTETALTLLGGMVAGKVNPINPLLSVEQIAGILRASNAKVLVTLKSFPKTNISQLASAAVAKAPGVRHVIEIDMLGYIKPPKSWIAGLLRPKNPVRYTVPVSDFSRVLQGHRGDQLEFEDTRRDRVVALFHTGGTTGIPKLVQHRQGGLIYNGWCSTTVGINHDSVVICPLPLFHVFAAYAIMMSILTTGAHVVFPTPAGYRGDGVFDNFWKLIERWKATYMITVPTALAALMQRKVDADVSSLELALCGSAPLPVELFNRFETATGVKILEGYGLTEVTCLVSINPTDGERKVGSVGLPFNYSNVRILDCDRDGTIRKECGPDEVGEICISSPGVISGHTYTEDEKNQGLFADVHWVRTGDLGRFDSDGYLWITGRSKDLIIRGGHNIDPAIIEDVLAGHEMVAFTGAIGQPDERLGEVPCVYVELVEGASVSEEQLLQYAQENITDRLARPVHLEILDTLPKTAVGKVFKPDLRKMAIMRVLTAALSKAGLEADIVVDEDPKRGLVAEVRLPDGVQEQGQVGGILGGYAVQWDVST